MSQNQKKNESFIQWFLVIPYVWIFNHFSKSITWSKHKPSQLTESQHELFCGGQFIQCKYTEFINGGLARKNWYLDMKQSGLGREFASFFG